MFAFSIENTPFIFIIYPRGVFVKSFFQKNLFGELLFGGGCGILKINDITQSVGCSVEEQQVKREPGENPGRYQPLYASERFFASSVKAGHWETEKAEAKAPDVVTSDKT